MAFRLRAGAALAVLLAVGASAEEPKKGGGRRPDLTLLFFTAPWCGPCKAVAPILEKVRQKHPKRVQLVIVDYDTAVDEVRRWEVEEIPVVIGLGRGGEVAFRAEGAGAETLHELEAGIVRFLERAGKKGGKRQ